MLVWTSKPSLQTLHVLAYCMHVLGNKSSMANTLQTLHVLAHCMHACLFQVSTASLQILGEHKPTACMRAVQKAMPNVLCNVVSAIKHLSIVMHCVQLHMAPAC